jgi:hypothetical protein
MELEITDDIINALVIEKLSDVKDEKNGRRSWRSSTGLSPWSRNPAMPI